MDENKSLAFYQEECSVESGGGGGGAGYDADESDACTIIVKWKVRDHNHIRCMLLRRC